MQKTVYVSSSVDVELRPPKDKKRSSFFLQNPSGFSVLYSEDTIATAENGIEIGPGQFFKASESDGQAVPQGNVWIKGTDANLQRVLVKED